MWNGLFTGAAGDEKHLMFECAALAPFGPVHGLLLLCSAGSSIVFDYDKGLMKIKRYCHEWHT